MKEAIPSTPNIVVDGNQFEMVKERLKGGLVYRSEDHEQYLRIGNPFDTRQEHIQTVALKNRGYPVANVLKSGEIEGKYYFIDASLGDRHFGEIFAQDTTEIGHARDDNFNEFIQITAKYFEAQCKPRNHVRRAEPLSTIVNMSRFLMSYDDIDETKIRKVIEKASANLQHLPFTYQQTDFNAYNVMPGGVIDFEFLHTTPLGYDVISGIHFSEWWPKQGGLDYKQSYRFTREQKMAYIMQLDALASNYKHPAPSNFTDDYLVLKTIWAAAKPRRSLQDPLRHARFWAWRREAVEIATDAYLEGRSISQIDFSEIDRVILNRMS